MFYLFFKDWYEISFHYWGWDNPFYNQEPTEITETIRIFEEYFKLGGGAYENLCGGIGR